MPWLSADQIPEVFYLASQSGQYLCLDIDPEARSSSSLTPKVLAVALGDEHYYIKPEHIQGEYFAELTVGTYQAKEVQRALWRVHPTLTPKRWLCCYTMAQLLKGEPRPLPLNDIAGDCQQPTPPNADEGLEALGQRADAICRILKYQGSAVRDAGLSWVAKAENDAVLAVAQLERNGMPFDSERWQSMTRAHEEEMASTLHRLREILKLHDSSLSLGQYTDIEDATLRSALHQQGYQVPNLRRHTLASLPAPLGPTLSRWRELKKILAAYGDAFLTNVQSDGRIHPTFVQIGASSGRMACENPNLQSMHKGPGFRECFRTTDENRLIIADYSACELRILAELSQDPVFTQAFQEGADVHSLVATQMFGIPVSKTENTELRQRAKAINFGLCYGMGPQGLASNVGVSIEAARKLFQSYFKQFPNIRRFLEGNADRALRQGYAKTLGGRRAMIPKTMPEHSQRRLAKNLPIQGTNADILKSALARLARRLPAHAKLVNTVHDEIVVEAPAPIAQDISHVVKSEMEQAGQSLLRRVPTEVSIEIKQYWAH